MAKVVRKGNKWVCTFYDMNKKRRRPEFNTKPEAENFKRDLILRSAGLDKSMRVNTFLKISEAIRKYFESVSINKSKQSAEAEKKYFEKMYDFLFDIQNVVYMSDVELFHMEAFQNHLRKNVSGSTVNRHFNTYKHFFNKCTQWGLIAKNPCDQIKKMREEPKHRKLWTLEEMTNVINECPKWAGDVLFFIACTAVRSGEEVKRLVWSDIDFENNLIRLKNKKGSGEVRTRFVPMTENLFNFMTEKKDSARKNFRGRDTDRVFLNSKNNPVESDVLCRVLREACKKLGYVGLVPYGLRHKALTDLAISNEGMEKIRMIAGHASISTTQQYFKLKVNELKGSLDKTTSRELVRAVTNGHRGLE